MRSLRIEFPRGNLFLPELDLWMDPHEPKLGTEKVFISHAHSDHIEAHREVILSAPTAKLMEARIPGKRLQRVLSFGEKSRFANNGTDFDLTLLPAGHIFGSAMGFVETGGESLLYTGDFKLRHGLSAEACEPRQADVLIMETTYGRPKYVFPPTAEVLKGVIRFCREALDNEETPVLLGYSLGKSQELLCGLAEAGFPLMLHGAIFKLTRIYQQFGHCFSKYEPYEAGSARGEVLLCPPNVINSAMLRNLGKTRTAILTGWAVDPNCRFRYQCDAAFPLSDHADFPDLLEMVKQVKPKLVYTLHGFAADFAQTLRGLGYEARALSQDEQLTLEIPNSHSKSKRESFRSKAAEGPIQVVPEEVHPSLTGGSFLDFAETCSHISADARKLEKVRLLARYLRSLQGDPLAFAATWFTGRPFPSSHNKVLQLGWAVLRDALCTVGELDQPAFHQIYLKHSDSGETAMEILEHHAVPRGTSTLGDSDTNKAAPTSRGSSPKPGGTRASLSIIQVHDLFQKLHGARGSLAKTPLLIRALELCTPIEGKYLVKIISGDLRIGLKEGLVEEAVASAFGKKPEEVRQANLLVGDIGEVARLAAEDRLDEATLTPFRPVKFMLASPEETAQLIWERVRQWSDAAVKCEAAAACLPSPRSSPSLNPHPSPLGSESGTAASANARPQVWIEDKFDGVRCQLHKVGQRVALYSRDLKDITTTFLELADSARKLAGDLILDGEIVAMREDTVLPFSELQKRLGRRQDDLFMREEVPIKLVAFDLLWLNGQSLLHQPLRERRRILETIGPVPQRFRLAQIARAESAEEIEAEFAAARFRDNEGLMIKEPGSFYTPGRRGLAWLKLKKAFATLDCVVVGAEYGHGKRSKVLSDYTFAVREDATGELKTIGKAYSGLTDAEIARLTEHFLKHARRQQGRCFEVEPDTVLEIAFDRLQVSGRHSSGFAMRFPRIVRIRTDKPVSEIDTIATAQKLAGKHRLS